MRMKVITVAHQKGVGKKSNQPYDFFMVGGLVTTTKGIEYAEVMIDGDKPKPEGNKEYDLLVESYPDREKRLQFRVTGLVVPGSKPA